MLRLLALSLFASLWLPISSSTTQRPLELPQTQSRTLVDALSADPDYTTLLQLLMSARLIPTLNRLNGSTLFAPTNDAIERHSKHNKLWRDALDSDSLVDNVHEELRQQLFYHIINSTIMFTNEPHEKVHILQTLHFPKPLDPPSRDPPPNPPWIPRPGGTLGGEPQRLRLAARQDSAWVGVDASGKGGSRIVKGRVDAGNGILLGLDGVLETPPDLATAISQHKSISYFWKILTPETKKTLNSTSELTLFLPVDPAWDSLDHYERLYLESEFANDDLVKIFNMHAVVSRSVKWSQSFGDGLSLTTIDGSTLDVVVGPDKTTISSADLVKPDIYASNGVLHLVSSLLIPPGALQITPEKHLLALHCASFVSLIHSTNLTHLINDTETKVTILAPSDDVMSVFGESDLPERGSLELQRMLQYHFIPGKWQPKKLTNGTLLETELKEDGLRSGRQVLPVEINLDTDAAEAAKQSITFGGVSILDGPIEVNNTIIYFISRPLTPPVDVLQAVLPNLDLSSFLAAVFSTSVADTLKTTPSTSLLIPHNSAFERLGGLVSEHLLAPASKADLESVLLHHTLDGVEYSKTVLNGSQHSFSTLEGSDINLERAKNGTLFVRPSGGWEGMKGQLFLADTLTRTGVVHELSDILLPRSLNLTVGKLVKAAKGNTMSSIVTKAGMDWILNGTAPPEGSPWADKGLQGSAWTLLCPTDDAFKPWNLTELFGNVELLKAIVAQHLIPVPPTKDLDDPLNYNRPIFMDENPTYSTLRSPAAAYGDIIFRIRSDDPNTYLVGIKGARGTDGKADWAKVLSWGRATTGAGKGGVVRIDRLLMPYQPSWWVEYGGPTFLLGMGLVVISAFFYGVNVAWHKDSTEATYEPVGGFDEEDT